MQYNKTSSGKPFLKRENFSHVLKGENFSHDFFESGNYRGCRFEDCNFSFTIFVRYNFSNAEFIRCNFHGARFSNCNFRGTRLYDCNFRDALFENIKTNESTRMGIPMTCPDTGSFIGWKAGRNYIIKLEIPEDAERSSSNSRKCRCSKAKVLEIQSLTDETILHGEDVSFRGGLIYRVGEMVYPDEWDPNRWNECSHGIHFFLTKEEALYWQFAGCRMRAY